jgi:hypothetical protein
MPSSYEGICLPHMRAYAFLIRGPMPSSFEGACLPLLRGATVERDMASLQRGGDAAEPRAERDEKLPSLARSPRGRLATARGRVRGADASGDRVEVRNELFREGVSVMIPFLSSENIRIRARARYTREASRRRSSDSSRVSALGERNGGRQCGRAQGRRECPPTVQ